MSVGASPEPMPYLRAGPSASGGTGEQDKEMPLRPCRRNEADETPGPGSSPPWSSRHRMPAKPRRRSRPPKIRSHLVGTRGRVRRGGRPSRSAALCSTPFERGETRGEITLGLSGVLELSDHFAFAWSGRSSVRPRWSLDDLCPPPRATGTWTTSSSAWTGAVGLSQHPDQHRPQRPVLLAVDQELGEGGICGLTRRASIAGAFGPAL